ncbi:MAG: adenylate/guanylate cyclase domain-containing protein [Spirochaetia bacterium]
MLEPSLRNELIELIAANFNPDEMDELGTLLFSEYDSHNLIGESSHVTLSRRRAAKLLVEHAAEKDKIKDLVKLVAELDNGIFRGRRRLIDGIENYFYNLAKIGIIYNSQKRKLYFSKEEINKMKNWGTLRNGRIYPVSIMSVDIVDNSGLVRKYRSRKMEKMYFGLWNFLERKLNEYEGRMWNWAGDGGILAFALKGHQERAVKCAVDIQRSLALFNISSENPIPEFISLRIGIDTGMIKFFLETGKIVSDVINYAAHLEKKAATPGNVAVSERVASELDPKIVSIFKNCGDFEGTDYFATTERLDTLFVNPENGCVSPISEVAEY